MEKPFIHKEKTLDSTLSLLRSPYLFISRRLDEYGTDGFETRLMLRKTVCLRGEEAARLFYDTSKFTYQERRRSAENPQNPLRPGRG